MAVKQVRTLPDPVLRRKAKRVSPSQVKDGSIKKLIADMTETMHAASGVGLAAPQVGVSVRVLVLCMPGEESIALINPKVVKKKGERLVTEGCLSVPGYYGEVKRAESVVAKGLDPNGKEIRIKGEELLAQALEHEIDHLNGVLYIDHIESEDELHKAEPGKLQL